MYYAFCGEAMLEKSVLDSDSICATLSRIHHDHEFGQGHRVSAESRALLVAVVTVIVMCLEIGFGLWTGSMALLADGVRMGGHIMALGLVAAD
jgi:Co/Zn/Cd efflux system component